MRFGKANYHSRSARALFSAAVCIHERDFVLFVATTKPVPTPQLLQIWPASPQGLVLSVETLLKLRTTGDVPVALKTSAYAMVWVHRLAAADHDIDEHWRGVASDEIALHEIAPGMECRRDRAAITPRRPTKQAPLAAIRHTAGWVSGPASARRECRLIGFLGSYPRGIQSLAGDKSVLCVADGAAGDEGFWVGLADDEVFQPALDATGIAGFGSVEGGVGRMMQIADAVVQHAHEQTSFGTRRLCSPSQTLAAEQ